MSSGTRWSKRKKVKEDAAPAYGLSTERLLLDTHVWIWLEEGHERLKKSQAFAQIRWAAGHSFLRVSPFSVWEIGMLDRKGRLHLTQSCSEWIHNALKNPGIALAPFTPEIALDATRLPGSFHNDPIDQMLIATARELRARLVTADKQIIAYGREHYVNVLAV